MAGWWYTYPSEKCESQLDDEIPQDIWNNTKCSSHHQPDDDRYLLVKTNIAIENNPIKNEFSH